MTCLSHVSLAQHRHFIINILFINSSLTSSPSTGESCRSLSASCVVFVGVLKVRVVVSFFLFVVIRLHIK